MNGFRDSYQETKKAVEAARKKAIEEEEPEDLQEEEQEEEQGKKPDSLLKLLQLQLTVCMIFFLLVIGAKTVNSTFYTAVRAGTFEKSYRLTNLWDINTKLDTIAGSNKLFGFILGRSGGTAAESAAKDTASTSSDSSGVSSKSGVSSEVTTGAGAEGSDTVSTFAAVTNTGILATYASAKKIPTLDEAAVTSESVEDEAEEEINNSATVTGGSDTSSSSSSGNTQSDTSAVKIPACDSAVHDWNVTYYNPVKSYITCKFGLRTDPITKKPGFHTGVDIGVVVGTEVICPAKGTVTKTGKSSVWGNYILVTHDNGFQTFYAHLSKIKVKAGAAVKAKAVLGLSGNTGRSTGPHLHFEVRFNGKYQDPLLYFDFK